MSSAQENPITGQGAVFKSGATQQRVLLVDNNDLNRQLLEEYLVSYQYQVLSISSGSSFFQALAEFQPHLILLDLKLPDIDGYTLLARIKQGTDWQYIPVIVVSTLAFAADQQRAFNLGVRRYFVKPVNLSDLRQAIHDELGGFKT